MMPVMVFKYLVLSRHAVSKIGLRGWINQFYNHTGVKDEILQNSKVTYTPDPPQLGKNLTLTLTGNLSESVHGKCGNVQSLSRFSVSEGTKIRGCKPAICSLIRKGVLYIARAIGCSLVATFILCCSKHANLGRSKGMAPKKISLSILICGFVNKFDHLING